MKPFEEIQAERLISAITYLANIDKESLENSFVVFYKDTNTAFLVNGKGWSEEQRIEYIERLIAQLNVTHPAKHPDRKITAQSGNVYFVY